MTRLPNSIPISPLLAVVLLGFGALGREASPVFAEDVPPTAKTFEETIDVRIFDFEIVVEDARGQRVRGLNAEDFQLLVDGKPVPIDYFSEISEGRALNPERLPTTATPGEGLKEIGIQYLVFIDELFAEIPLRNEALAAMALQVDQLGPADQMAVVAYSGEHFQVLSGWSGDRQHLRKLYETAAKEKASLVERADVELTSHLKYVAGGRAGRFVRGTQPLSAGAETPDAGGDSEALAGAGYVIWKDQVEGATRSIEAALSALHAFADTAGRKVLILVSAGWPLDLEIDNLPVIGANPLWRLADEANSLGYTLYPVRMERDPSIRFSAAEAQQATQRARSAPIRTLGESLQDLAAETGGYMLASGGNKSLARIRRDASSFYWLGMTSHQPSTDGRHEVEIEARQPGLEIRSRRSFIHQPPQQVAARRAKAALLTGLNPAGSEPLRVTTGVAQSAGRNRLEIPLSLDIPLDGLTFIPHQGGVIAQLGLQLISIDESGRDSPVADLELELPFDGPVAEGARATYDFAVQIRRKPQTLQVMMRDRAGEALLTAKVVIEP